MDSDHGGQVGGPAAGHPYADGMDDEPAEWWDVMNFEAAFGVPPAERAGDGEVCCRVCGEAVGALMPHIGPAHGIDKQRYTERWPAAPLGPPENEG